MTQRTHWTAKIILSFLLVPFIIWNLTYGFVVGIVLLAFYATGMLYSKKRKSIKPIFIGVASGFVLYLLMLPVTGYQLNNKNKKYHSIIKSGERLNVVQKVNVYGLTMLMGTVALPLFPESAIETLLMAIPDKDKIRTIESDFFMKSEKLKQHIAKYKGGHVHWTLKDYEFGAKEARVALALNPLDYTIKETEVNTIYKMMVPCHFHYGEDVLIETSFMRIAIDEYVIRHLEDEGWLFPYTMVWIYKEKK